MNLMYFAQKAFIARDGRLLVVRRSGEDPYNAGRWEVPGGRMQFGEDVDGHICREVKEEVGLEIRPGRPFHIWQWQLSRDGEADEPTLVQIVAVARLCEALTADISSRGRTVDDFLGETKWLSFDMLSECEWIPNMLPVVDAFLELVARSSDRQ